MRHCATCECGVNEPIPQPSTSSAWARRQAKEAAAEAVRRAKEARKKPASGGTGPTEGEPA